LGGVIDFDALDRAIRAEWMTLDEAKVTLREKGAKLHSARTRGDLTDYRLPPPYQGDDETHRVGLMRHEVDMYLGTLEPPVGAITTTEAMAILGLQRARTGVLSHQCGWIVGRHPVTAEKFR
jgi:hypothetical protein